MPGSFLRDCFPCQGAPRAPSGALRPGSTQGACSAPSRQGAPSTIRCIKTVRRVGVRVNRVHGQGAPSTIRCIKTRKHSRSVQRSKSSGSTQHHQVRSRLCSIGAGCGPQSKCQGVEACRCCGGASCGRAVSAPPVPLCREVRTQGARNRQRRSHTRAESSRCVRCCVA